MARVLFGNSMCVAAALLSLCAAPALAGFADLPDSYVPAEQQRGEQTSAAKDVLPFALDASGHDASKHVAPPAIDAKALPPTAVAAPLPGALLPGGAMIMGTFVATRVFKRRIV